MQNILLDMDEVLVDFFSGALDALNNRFAKHVTTEDFVKDNGGWDMAKYYGISNAQFWVTIENTPNFWLNLKPQPWYKELYDRLSKDHRVTVLTSPSQDPDCAKQKLQWLKNYLSINSDQVMIGSRKELLAGNGILIDDYPVNVNKFTDAGGMAILVPATWNTPNLTFDKVWSAIAIQHFAIENKILYVL
jgi:5'(3')-deoxyribonucleotidase